MSVPVNERSHGKLEVCTKAHALCCYTLQITKNKKIFSEEYQDVLTNRIIEDAIMIHSETWTANNILVKDSESYHERRRLQEDAARKCNDLLSLMDIAKSIFHLESKRIVFWGGMATETRKLIRAWRDSDSERYRQYK